MNFHQYIKNCYDEINIRRQSGNFQFVEDLFGKNVQGIGRIYHDVSFLMKFLQTKPSVKIMHITFYDLYHTVNKKEMKKKL